jgi:hypothetical protein
MVEKRERRIEKTEEQEDDTMKIKMFISYKDLRW